MEKELVELAIAFRDFIYRDLIYMGGGLTVLLSFARGLGILRFGEQSLGKWRLLYRKIPRTFTLYVLFISWVIGYTTLEVFSVAGIVTTGYSKPSPVTRWLLNRWGGGGVDWAQMPDRVALEDLSICPAAESPERHSLLIRTIDLGQLGSTMGACLLLSAGIMFVGIIRRGRQKLDLTLAAAMLVTGIALAAIGRMKAVEHVKFVTSWKKEFCVDQSSGKSAKPETQSDKVNNDLQKQTR